MIHPQKRTWNLRIPDWKKEKTPIYKAPILGFHVSFRGFALEPRCLLQGFYPISAPRNLKSSRSFFRVLPRPSICSVCPLTAFLTKVWLLEVESQLHEVTVGYQWCLRWIRSHGHESFDPSTTMIVDLHICGVLEPISIVDHTFPISFRCQCFPSPFHFVMF